MSCTIGLVGEHQEGRRWKIGCSKCGEGWIVKLPFGGLEEYLMGLHVCPGGRHKVEIPGEGLWVERYYPQGTRD